MNEKIEKYPKWLQDYVKKLERQRNEAVRELYEYMDEQTPSPFYISEFLTIESPPKHFVRYVQAHQMEVNHDGVYLQIILRDGQIDLSWGSDPNRVTHDVAFIPQSHQSARLVTKENMR